MVSTDVIDSLFPAGLPEPAHWEERYPPRNLPDGAEVTRFAPSPTGYLHIGGIYVAMIDKDISGHSNGRYLVRIEDTDQARLTEGAAEQFQEAFTYFDINPDDDQAYGPIRQSERRDTYLSYVRQLLREGKAYPCFATKEQLADITARQKATGALPGYYGQWAIWRDAPEADVLAKLEAGEPYVVRFRSPGLARQRITFHDEIRGDVVMDDNRNDLVILKSTEPRLPTYHMAHAVDDHLMRVTLVIRGEEWLSSVPQHLQLFDALGFTRVRYAHIAFLMKQDGSSRRKLSKRKDPEASVSYYMEQGIPDDAVEYYLRGLANGRLAEMPLNEALRTPIRLDLFGTAAPLADMVKLDDISADYVSTLSGEQIIVQVREWASIHDPDLVDILDAERDVALRALAIERGSDVPNPRKDLRKWSDFRAVYGYFFPEIFEPVTDPSDPRFDGLSPDLVQAIAAEFAGNYLPPGPDVDWFNQIRELTERLGFAPSRKAHKAEPDKYPGSIIHTSQVIRVLLTGSGRSPNLPEVTGALGTDEVLRRTRAVLGRP